MIEMSQKKSMEDKLKDFSILSLTGAALVMGGLNLYDHLTRKIDQAYLKPEQIEIITKDRNDDGYEETILKIKDNGKVVYIDLTKHNLDYILSQEKHLDRSYKPFQ